MKIHEVERQLGISKANIRFYEKEGLLLPERKSNGYREYGEADLARLKRILILRKLGMAIPDIQKLLDGETALSDALDENLEQLNRQLEELNGAIEICRRMKKEAGADSDFDADYYWNLIHTREARGQKFAALLEDYVKTEQKLLLSMWGSVFWYDAKGVVKKHGWKLSLLLMLIICVARGILHRFLWQSGSFWEGFFYPFALFFILSAITFPLFAIGRKYRGAASAEEPTPEPPKWKTALKVLAAILYFPLIFGVLFLGEWLFWTPLANGRDYIAVSRLWLPYLLAALYLFLALVWLYGRHGVFALIGDGNGLRARLPRRTKQNVTAISALVLLAALALNFSCFDLFTGDGWRRQLLFYGKSYDWEDADHYTLSAALDGTLRVTVVMEDGASANLMGSISMSSLSEETYPEYEDDFVRALAKRFASQGVPLVVDDWEKLEKKLSYDYWRTFTEEIRVIAGE